MNWLAEQSLARVVSIIIAWWIVATLALYIATRLYLRWVMRNDPTDGGMNFYSVQVGFTSVGAFIVLLLPPIALLAAWAIVRRAR